MSWVEAVPAFLVASAVIFVPGLLIVGVAGGRGLFLWAAAGPVSVGALAALGTLYGLFGVEWSPASAALGVVLVAGVALAVGRLARRGATDEVVRPRGWSKRASATLVGLTVGALITTVQLVFVHGAPDNVSQTFDAAFHLNGVRYLLDIGSASSFQLSGLILPEGQSSFYPAAWHTVVVTVVQILDVSIPVAVNVVNIVVAALVWPAGAFVLLRIIVPTSVSAPIAAGVLVAAAPGFPLLMLDYGVLYPYFLALAMLPLALAISTSMLLRATTFALPWPVQLGTLGVTFVALALAQTAVLFASLALCVPLVIILALRYWRSDAAFATRRLVVLLTGVGLVLLAFAWVWVGRVGHYSPWGAKTDPVDGLYQTLALGHNGMPPAIALAALALVGVFGAFRSKRNRWLFWMWAIVAALYLLSMSLGLWTPRNWLLGLFYKDAPRFYGLLAVVVVPLAAYGAAVVSALLRRRPWLSERFRGQGAQSARVAASCVAIIALIAATQPIPMARAVEVASTKYALTEWSPLLNSDERLLIERLSETTPADARIVGNPWTGTSLAYVLSHRRVLNPHFNISPDPRHILVSMHLNEALDDPAVCSALDELGVNYVLDFGIYVRDAGGELSFDSTTNYKGLLDLAESGVVEEIDREGDAVLYEITACG